MYGGMAYTISMEQLKEKSEQKFKCQNCRENFKKSDYLFQSLFTPYMCPECNRDEYNEHLN